MHNDGVFSWCCPSICVCLSVCVSVCFRILKLCTSIKSVKTSYRPGGRRDDMSQLLAVRFAARVRCPHVAKLQAASVPIAYGSCAMG